MKKNYLLMGLLAMGLCVATSCSSDDDNETKDENNESTKELTEAEAQNLDYTSANAAAWGNYAVNVANLLAQDSRDLYNQWNNSYAAAFKSHNASVTGFNSALECVEQIIDGCIDIATEVGSAKIGEPVQLYKDGKTTQALYAVESWYSWHSRDDYKNNILSIVNTLLGQRITGDPSNYDRSQASQNSIIVKCMQSNALRQPSITVWQNACDAWTAIHNIPQPFRNNINSAESESAIDACAALSESLEALKSAILDNMSEETAQAIVNQFVDVVAMPTYQELVAKNQVLQQAVSAFQANPSNQTFALAAEAWLNARAPWETSEAFLFGPVAELGLDPNMDSWPLDVVAISNLLISQQWSDMNWSGEYEATDEDDPDASSEHAKAIEAAQSVRGYHTLEFLLFKNGTPRTIAQ